MRYSDQEILDAYDQHGSFGSAAVALGIDRRGFARRVNRLRPTQRALSFPAPAHMAASPAVLQLPYQDGTVVVGSDAHYWPGQEPSTAHVAFCRTIRELHPWLVVLNGDIFDGASCSKHGKIGWESRPTVSEELAVCGERLKEIQEAATDAQRIWTLGNHDMRYETFMAQHASEYRNVPGIHLKDHFPDWQPAWRVDIGTNVTIQHRWKGGTGAGRNNTLNAGRSYVTGHDHVLQVTPFTDLNGTRWGVQGGMLGVPYSPQFVNYTEATPVNWRSGFVVLTFADGRLLEPELVSVISEEARITMFRGRITEEE